MIQKRRTRSRDLSKITPPKQKQEKGYCQSCHVLVPIEKAPPDMHGRCSHLEIGLRSLAECDVLYVGLKCGG